MDELASALLRLDFGQVWARYDIGQHIAQSGMRLWIMVLALVA